MWPFKSIGKYPQTYKNQTLGETHLKSLTDDQEQKLRRKSSTVK